MWVLLGFNGLVWLSLLAISRCLLIGPRVCHKSSILGVSRCFSSSSSMRQDNHNTKAQHNWSDKQFNIMSGDRIRVNKCLPLSRRASDKAIEEGRVTINGRICSTGDRVIFGDRVRLDGKIQLWEDHVKSSTIGLQVVNEARDHIYLKYWKPLGVVCTNDQSQANNIISAGKLFLFPQRLFTVGRLDKDSTGLIIITSDGRINNALLSKRFQKQKVYEVEMNKYPSEAQLDELRRGVLITTPVQRDSGSKFVTTATLPCKITRISHSNKLQFVLVEGRNRQIRRMAEAVGLRVTSLHRTAFAGITAKGLVEGNWLELNRAEMAIIKTAIEYDKGIDLDGTLSALDDEQ